MVGLQEVSLSKTLSEQMKLKFQDAMMNMRDVKNGPDLDIVYRKGISWLILAEKVVESVGSCQLPIRWYLKMILMCKCSLFRRNK